MAAKKTAAKKKRTPAQRRATARLVAMNKKKRAGKKRPAVRRTAASKKKAARRRNPVRPLRSRGKKKAASRKRNPVGNRHYVVFHRNKGGDMYVAGLGSDGISLQFSSTLDGAALFTKTNAEVIATLIQNRSKISGMVEVSEYYN